MGWENPPPLLALFDRGKSIIVELAAAAARNNTIREKTGKGRKATGLCGDECVLAQRVAQVVSRLLIVSEPRVSVDSVDCFLCVFPSSSHLCCRINGEDREDRELP
nr:hypothetical protein Iba_chr15aCG11560 [Ipomoea batatas]